jgi:predicted transcriptional regulator
VSTNSVRRTPLGLGPLETAIMRTLWDTVGQWLTVRDIQDRIDYPPVAYSTVASVTLILCGKGLLYRKLGSPTGSQGSPSWCFRPATTATEHIGGMIATLLDNAPDPHAALSYALACAHNAAVAPPRDGQRPEMALLSPRTKGTGDVHRS